MRPDDTRIVQRLSQFRAAAPPPRLKERITESLASRPVESQVRLKPGSRALRFALAVLLVTFAVSLWTGHTTGEMMARVARNEPGSATAQPAEETNRSGGGLLRFAFRRRLPLPPGVSDLYVRIPDSPQYGEQMERMAPWQHQAIPSDQPGA